MPAALWYDAPAVAARLLLSGTVYNQTVGGAITPSGALTSQKLKALAGALTPTGALTRTVSRAFGGAITPAGALLKTTTKLLSATLAPTGVLVRTARKVLGGAVSPTGVLARALGAFRAFTGSISSSGATVTTHNPFAPPTNSEDSALTTPDHATRPSHFT